MWRCYILIKNLYNLLLLLLAALKFNDENELKTLR